MANQAAHEQRILKAARALAETGEHNSWFHIACALKERGEPLATNILEREPYRSELDKRCADVRRRLYGKTNA